MTDGKNAKRNNNRTQQSKFEDGVSINNKKMSYGVVIK